MTICKTHKGICLILFQKEKGSNLSKERINNAMNLFHSKDVGEEIISLKHLEMNSGLLIYPRFFEAES